MNIQRVSKHRFEMYLAKYIFKPEPSFQVNLSENASDPEKYLHTIVVGSCVATTAFRPLGSKLSRWHFKSFIAVL